MTRTRFLVLVLLAAVATAQVFVRPRARGTEVNPVQMGTTLPPTCEEATLFIDKGSGTIYACTSQDSWTQLWAGGEGLLAIGEIPSGAVNGSNRIFTLSHTPAGSIALYRNGLRQKQGEDYDIAGAVITFTVVSTPQSGDLLQADYSY